MKLDFVKNRFQPCDLGSSCGLLQFSGGGAASILLVSAHICAVWEGKLVCNAEVCLGILPVWVVLHRLK